jgi:hypothetical protein
MATKLSSLVQPADFSPLRDDDSVIGFHHTRSYQIRKLCSDEWCVISETRWTWDEAIAVAEKYLADGAHHINITGIDSVGRGYAPAKHTYCFRVVADAI